MQCPADSMPSAALASPDPGLHKQQQSQKNHSTNSKAWFLCGGLMVWPSSQDLDEFEVGGEITWDPPPDERIVDVLLCHERDLRGVWARV